MSERGDPETARATTSPEAHRRLLSVDMGSRNVAYAVADFGTRGLAGGVPEDPGGSLRFLAWDVEDVSGEAPTDLIGKTVELAGRLVEDHGPFDQVALENQLGRFAARNKTVQSVLHASMLLLCPGCSVVNVSPQCKTILARKLLRGSSVARVTEKAAGKSDKRASSIVQKQTVMIAATELLEEPDSGSARRVGPFSSDDARWMLAVLRASAKKDDLCDCLLQALHVLERGGLLSLVPSSRQQGPPRAGGGGDDDSRGNPNPGEDVPSHRLTRVLDRATASEREGGGGRDRRSQAPSRTRRKAADGRREPHPRVRSTTPGPSRKPDRPGSGLLVI